MEINQGALIESSSMNGLICFAPKAQFKPMLIKFLVCETEIRNASVVCPDKVLPLWSTIVPEIITGICLLFSLQYFSIAKIAALLFNVSNIVSTNKISTDRKSTRLNSSHLGISYAVFCLKKKK